MRTGVTCTAYWIGDTKVANTDAVYTANGGNCAKSLLDLNRDGKYRLDTKYSSTSIDYTEAVNTGGTFAACTLNCNRSESTKAFRWTCGA